MNTPRLALAVLLAAAAVAAPAPSFADTSWGRVQPGDDWVSITFRDEANQLKSYWFRRGATGTTPLYSIIPKPNPDVRDSVYYESVVSAYVLQITPHRTQRGGSLPTTYTVSLPGTRISVAGTPGVNLGQHLWDKDHAPTYETVNNGRRGSQQRRTNPYEAGSIKVVVAEPREEHETVPATPMADFISGVSPINWNEYYFARAARPAPARGSDTDRAYRNAKLSYEDLHSRVLPMEVMLLPRNRPAGSHTTCFISPETCGSSDSGIARTYVEAGEQARQGNFAKGRELAIAAHQAYKGRAQELLTALDSAPADSFTAEETLLLQRLLVNANLFGAFQTELAGVRGDATKTAQFVTKWRTYVKAELTRFVAAPELASGDKVNAATERAGLISRAQAAQQAPLAPPAPADRRNPPATTDPATAPPPAVPPATDAPAPAADPAVVVTIALSPLEQTWLDKKQLEAYQQKKTEALAKPEAERLAALKPVNDEYRAEIVKNLAPNTSVADAYTAAAAAPQATNATIDATLTAPMWGGDNAEIVRLFGAKSDIQLSEEEWNRLSATPPARPEFAAASEQYKNANASANGGGDEEGAFNAATYDPIVLHRETLIARAALGAPAASEPAPTAPAEDPTNLTADELAKLSPAELTRYNGLLGPATGAGATDQSRQALRRINAEFRALTAARTAYVAPTTAAEYAALDDWKKDRFCAELAPGQAAAPAAPAPELVGTGTGDARADLDANAPGAPRAPGAQAAVTPWSGSDADAACQARKREAALAGGNPPTTPGQGLAASVVPPAGVEKEPEGKKPNPWISADLLTNGAKGAIFGLLVGSLFGPVGLVAGPVLGAALFYGLTKVTSK